ncbi:PHP domain-containing protein [Aphanothece sacrum]|uniref:Phosphoesterase n=1 Tax=Aphanothece sacrum FPU1 TaxID=1920663 RepID=A0A401IEN2_APHSA|nr:PHP domain-containing protein [Aphanothece sacrum]GBF79686.1 phosphoesterase [Aphanothece sacrum FPU1]GBF87146.1 phosphoesterase [Aphanothece sacrum FPU3]
MIVSISTQSSAQDTQTLKRVWQTLHRESCPYDYNFHMHTLHSDGRLKPEELIQQAITIGLKGMAITDHHSLNGYRVAQKWIDDIGQTSPQTPLPHLWTGIEITSLLLDIEVHILGYGFDPNHPIIQPYLTGNSPKGTQALAEQVIKALHQAGGLTVLAHPCRYHRSAVELIPAIADLGIDGIETFYAYSNPKPWKASLKETEQMLTLSQFYGLFNTCGTDTHGVNLLQRI